MKHILILVLISVLILSGCSKTEMAVVEPEIPPPDEEEIVVLPEPEVLSVENDTATVSDEKQLALGSTDISEEEQSMVSDVVCGTVDDEIVSFSFVLNNIEDKKWKFSPISYYDRQTIENPVVILNALQMQDGILISNCGRKTLDPGLHIICSFDLADPGNILVKKHLRTGETAMGNVNENVLSVKTTGHAAEVVFLCE